MPRGAAPLRRSAVPLLRVFATAAENAREAREKSTASPQANSWERKEESRFELETGPWAGLEEALSPPPERPAFLSLTAPGTTFSRSAKVTAHCVPTRLGPRRRNAEMTVGEKHGHCPMEWTFQKHNKQKIHEAEIMLR